MSSSDEGSEMIAEPTSLGRVLALDGVKMRFQLLFFIFFIASSGFIVFRNVYLEEIGLSGSQMGLIGFLLMATGVVVQPAWGLLTDYFRAERTVLVVAGIASAVAILSYPVGGGLTDPFLLLALGTAAYSAFRTPIGPIASGMVLSRGLDYGSVRAFGSLAFAIGSLGFGFVVGTLGSVSVVYFYVAGTALMVGIAWSLPGDRSADEDDHAAEDNEDGTNEPGLLEATRMLVTSPTFLVIVGASFLLRLSAMGGEAFFSVYMRSLDIRLGLGPWMLGPDEMTGVGWPINSGIEAVAFIYALRMNRSHRWLLVAGGALLTIPNLVYGLTTNPVALLAIQSFGGVGFAMVTVATVDLANDIAAERVTSTAQTLLDGFGFSLGGAAGQIVAGTLFDVVGIMDMYIGIAVLGFAGAALGLAVSADDRSGKNQPTP